LEHSSSGEGKDRHIVLRKPQDGTKKSVPPSAEAVVEFQGPTRGFGALQLEESEPTRHHKTGEYLLLSVMKVYHLFGCLGLPCYSPASLWSKLNINHMNNVQEIY